MSNHVSASWQNGTEGDRGSGRQRLFANRSICAAPDVEWSEIPQGADELMDYNINGLYLFFRAIRRSKTGKAPTRTMCPGHLRLAEDRRRLDRLRTSLPHFLVPPPESVRSPSNHSSSEILRRSCTLVCRVEELLN